MCGVYANWSNTAKRLRSWVSDSWEVKGKERPRNKGRKGRRKGGKKEGREEGREL
jgi:hypothetical protein